MENGLKAKIRHPKPVVIRIDDADFDLAIGSAFFASNYILYFFLSWMPSYLMEVHHLDIKTMGALTVVPWTFGLIGSVGGGMMSDAILRRTGDGIFARKVMIVGSLVEFAGRLRLGRAPWA